MDISEKKALAAIIEAFIVIFVLAGVIKSFNMPEVSVETVGDEQPSAVAPVLTDKTAEPEAVTTDAALTAKFRVYLSDNFEDTSWYRYITDVTVLTSGRAIIDTSMFAKDSNKAIAESMANSALLYGDQIESVRINASDGLPLFSKNK